MCEHRPAIPTSRVPAAGTAVPMYPANGAGNAYEGGGIPEVRRQEPMTPRVTNPFGESGAVDDMTTESSARSRGSARHLPTGR